jgi:hypothetical protein
MRSQDYKKILESRYLIIVPDGMPLYMQEQLYSDLTVAERQGNTKPFVLNMAKSRIDFLIRTFPWLTTSHDDVLEIINYTPMKRNSPSEYEDGTIIFSESKKQFVCYVDGKIATRGNTLERVKELATKRVGITEFNYINQ